MIGYIWCPVKNLILSCLIMFNTFIVRKTPNKKVNVTTLLTVCPHLPPLRSSRLGSGPQSSDGVSLLLLGQKVQCHLQADGLHVILTERWRHVHVHLQEAAWQTTEVHLRFYFCVYIILIILYRAAFLCHSAPPLSHLLAPHRPGPSPAWSINWQTIQMTSGLCWSRWSQPAGSKTD